MTEKAYRLAQNIDKLELTERERAIVEFRFGLTPSQEVKPHTLAETGKIFGVSRQRVKQIEDMVFEKLKSLLNNHA